MPTTLLVVDDDVVDRTAVRRAFASSSMAVAIREAGNFEEVLEALQSGGVDCVLLDYRLPRTDGLEVLNRLRALGHRVPVIVLTGQGDEQLAADMMRAGASDYLVKQALSPDRLERSLRHALAVAALEAQRREALASEQAARREAQAANLAKDEFLATLSHELRTPLNAILGWARLLTSGALDQKTAARALQIIERNAISQVKLIDDLLDISRVVTGKLQLDLVPVNFAAVVETVVESARPHALSKSIDLAYNGQGTCQVLGDAARLQQIVGNLVSNALKFTPENGRVVVSLSCAGERAVLAVADTGVGIDPAFLPHAFDRFRQADGTATRRHGGLGLGLAIVRHLVLLHRGEVRAESDGENRGAVFTIELPLAGTEHADEAALPDREVVEASLAGTHVLAVDDEPDALALVEAILSARGARVTTVCSVRAALEAIRREQPDVLLSDVAMPGEDGYALIGALRRSEAAGERALPAAAITAYAAANDRARALQDGFQAHLAKPIDAERLVAVVAQLAGRAVRS